MFHQYVSPLVQRYASREMAELFSPLSYARSWRRVWLALAEAQHKVGAPVTALQLEAMRRTIDDIDLARVAAIEAETRHDVMAHLRAWAEKCPEAKPILHLGATSQYVNDNGDALIFRQALQLTRNRLVNVIRALASFAHNERDRPTLGYTHFQPAQLVTAGKRACLWIHDLLLDLGDLSQRLEELPCRGAKGTVGTQASFLEILGSAKKVKQLDQHIAELLGFSRAASVTGQSLSRKHDVRMLDALAGIGVSLSKLGVDVRLLMHTGELREPFHERQVGSSAMPYKRNPILAERLCSLVRLIVHARNAIVETAGVQWLERSLDDSATRRVAIPEAFLACEGALRVAHELCTGLQVDTVKTEEGIKAQLPFLAVEAIIAEVVKAGGDRQEAHERLRGFALKCYADPGESFQELILADPTFAFLRKRLRKLLDPKRLTGLASTQVEDFLEGQVRPALKRFRDVPAVADQLSV